ncbi:MAG TPA: molybdopterin molybdotransferase MoeA [Clostridia bacterium]|nr:molybdopterin molybdotransferase MoeA [Clostridia bacterium]
MEELFRLTSLEEAKSKISSYWKTEPEKVRISVLDAFDKVLAEDIIAGADVPGFSRATVDGYAVRSSSTFGATEAMPAYLQVIGQIAMGKSAALAVGQGEGVGIPTGGMLPEQADAVVMVEYTEEMGQAEIAVTRPVSPGENVIKAGEDIRAGSLLFKQGHRLRPQDLGMLASQGILQVKVYSPFKVGIISTGNEIVAPEETPALGQVRDINSYTLYGKVQKSGALPTLYGIVPDDFQLLQETVQKALQENDLVLLSGGSSVGVRDYTVEVFKSLGEPGLLLHGIPVKPGKPTVVAAAGRKLLFGLPGHPVSAMVVYDILVHPLLYDGSYMNKMEVGLQARLARNLASAAGREDHIRVKLFTKDGELWAEPVLGKSGLIRTLVEAQGEIIIPVDREGLASGEIVNVKIF